MAWNKRFRKEIMRWKGRRQSDNVVVSAGGAGKTIGGLGIGGVVIYLLYALLGGNPADLGGMGFSEPGAVRAEVDPEAKEFVSVVLADTEEVWHELFRRQGRQYKEPKLVIFSGQVQSACGFANAAVGPFYCPEDAHLYIDFSFYDDLRDRYGAPGDFAQAYVIAHEVGHHVQHLLGITDRVHSQRGRISQKEFNQLSVRLELQADFLAGVWAHHAQRMASLDESDLREALGAANAIGDDRLQKQHQGYVVPDSFTHGSSEQRARWFLKGWKTGDPAQGDTFSAQNL